MSISICSSCLSRLRISAKSHPVLLSIPSTPSFHTTSSQNATPPKKKPGGGQGFKLVLKHREARSAKIKKKHRERPRPPAVGEIKAQKSRIVLSNTNAREVTEMQDLSVDKVANYENIGEVLGLEGGLLDHLREAKAFKTTQNWNMFRKPATLIRAETVDIGQGIQDVKDSIGDQETGPKTIRRVIAGERLSGKSLLLLQAMSMGFLNKWVVINIPEAKDFVNNQSSYAPTVSDDGSKEQLYVQPHLTSAVLSRMANANADVLGRLKVSHDHSASDLPISNKMSLQELAMLGVNDVPNAWPIWQAIWKELTEKSDKNTQPPLVMITVDGLDHWMGPSKYRSSNYKIIHSHQFLLIRQLVSLIFSKKPLANGGMILAATTSSNSPSTPSFDVLLRQLEARAKGIQMTDSGFPMPEPYSKSDQRVLNLLNGSEDTSVLRLNGLSKVETKGLLEYFAKSGILQGTVTDATVAEKWGLSGGGVIGEIARLGSRLRV